MTIEDIVGISIYELISYAKQYTIKYSNVIDDTKGRINYKYNTIEINPAHNDYVDTLVHELLHHHYDNETGIDMGEPQIEYQTKLICQDKFNVKTVKQYLKENTDLYRC
jgi:hypothetical protein